MTIGEGTTMTTTYTWCCDKFGCPWQASSESREQAHDWATEHTDTTRHPVSLYIEND